VHVYYEILPGGKLVQPSGKNLVRSVEWIPN